MATSVNNFNFHRFRLGEGWGGERGQTRLWGAGRGPGGRGEHERMGPEQQRAPFRNLSAPFPRLLEHGVGRCLFFPVWLQLCY